VTDGDTCRREEIVFEPPRHSMFAESFSFTRSATRHRGERFSRRVPELSDEFLGETFVDVLRQRFDRRFRRCGENPCIFVAVGFMTSRRNFARRGYSASGRSRFGDFDGELQENRRHVAEVPEAEANPFAWGILSA